MWIECTDPMTENTNVNTNDCTIKQPNQDTNDCTIKHPITGFFNQITNVATGFVGTFAAPATDVVQSMFAKYITGAETRFVDTHIGSTIAVHEMLGSGKGTILVIHGLGSCSSDWMDFLKLTQYKFSRILAIDIPGHGDSPFPSKFNNTMDDTCEFEWMVRSITETIVSITNHCDDITLVGNSLGGAIAAKIASTIPAKVSTLILFSPAGYPFDSAEKIRLTNKFTPKNFEECREMVNELTFVPMNKTVSIVSSIIIKERMMSPCVRMICDSVRAFPADYIFIKEHDLKMITAKTLVVWGTNDKIIPVKHVHYFSSIPNVTIETPDWLGHCPQTESPVYAVRRITEFIEENELNGLCEKD